MKGWRKIITNLEKSGDTVDHMRSALERSAQIMRDEIPGNEQLGQNLLTILPGMEDTQVREIHRKWLGDAHKAAESMSDLAQKLGYSIGSDSKCFIATAVCGENAAEVIALRHFRDSYLQTSLLGRTFIKQYYRFSPRVARTIQACPKVRTFVRQMIIRPVSKLITRLLP